MGELKYNILYGMLARSGVPESDRYYKRHVQVPATVNASALADLLVPARLRGADSGRLGLFVSAVCAAVLDTAFGNEIVALDPDNTYDRPLPPQGSRPVLYDLTCPPDELAGLRGLLDNDINERLVAPQWIDYMAAGCLQLLREMI